MARSLPKFFAQLRAQGVRSYRQFSDGSFQAEFYPATPVVRSPSHPEVAEIQAQLVAKGAAPVAEEQDAVAALDQAYADATEPSEATE